MSSRGVGSYRGRNEIIGTRELSLMNKETVSEKGNSYGRKEGDHSWRELMEAIVAGCDGNSIQHEAGTVVTGMVDLEDGFHPLIENMGNPLAFNTVYSGFFRETEQVG